MALDNVYYPHALRLPSPEITHLSSIEPDRGLQVQFESQAGASAPCFVGVAFTDPRLAFSTRQVKTVLDVIAAQALGENVVRDLSGDTVEMWYRAGRAMEIREAASTAKHVVCQLTTSAMLFWTQLSVTQGSMAEISATMATAKRGATDPMLWLGEQQLPARSGCESFFGMGPVLLNGTQIFGCTGWTLSSNATQEPISSDGVPANSYQGIRNYNIQVALQTNDIAELYNSSGGGDGFSTLELYLKKYASTNVYDADGSETHIKITVNGGLKTVPGASGSPVQVQPMFYAAASVGTPTHSWDTATSIA